MIVVLSHSSTVLNIMLILGKQDYKVAHTNLRKKNQILMLSVSRWLFPGKYIFVIPICYYIETYTTKQLSILPKNNYSRHCWHSSFTMHSLSVICSESLLFQFPYFYHSYCSFSAIRPDQLFIVYQSNVGFVIFTDDSSEHLVSSFVREKPMKASNWSIWLLFWLFVDLDKHSFKLDNDDLVAIEVDIWTYYCLGMREVTMHTNGVMDWLAVN